MKIVHISDLRIDAVNKKENSKKTKLLLEYINETNFDHLIITEDISESGDKESVCFKQHDN
jgi:3',5'-cyclic AMP phosphodiesterase CpdA